MECYERQEQLRRLDRWPREFVSPDPKKIGAVVRSQKKAGEHSGCADLERKEFSRPDGLDFLVRSVNA